MSRNVYLVWLEWPEECFRVNAKDMALLRTLVPAGSRVIRARTRKGFFAALGNATHVITWYFDPAWFEKAPRLKVLATPSAGRELLPKTGSEGVTIHFGHFHGPIMAESVAAFILAWARGFFLSEIKKMVWPRTEIGGKCFDVAGTKAVIAGYGHVGQAIGAKLETLGVEVKGFGRKNLKELPRACKTADWFVMALPGDTGTEKFLSKALISKLPRKAVVVNVGRGTAVDESALFAALKSGRLAGAYLDVRPHEPQKAPPPKGVPNLVLMPHASAFSMRYIQSVFKELKDDGLI